MSDAASLFGVLDHAAQHAPGKCALICAHTRTSFRELRDAATAVGSGLAELGLTAGDRLAVLTANRVEAVELFMACAYAGIVDVPLNAFLKGEFLSYQLRDSGVTAIAVDAAGLRALRAVLDRVPLITTVITFDEAADDQPASGAPRVVSYRSVRNAAEAAVAAARSPSDLMSILYTSGTTGAPKGCMLSDGYYLHVARVLADNMGVRADDTIFTALPFYHCTARSVVFLPALLNCATTVLEPGFDASATVARWAETGATINMGVGAMGLAVLAQPESNLDQSHQLRLNFSSPLTELDQDRLAQRFGAPVYAESYGQTECMPILSTGRRMKGAHEV